MGSILHKKTINRNRKSTIVAPEANIYERKMSFMESQALE